MNRLRRPFFAVLLAFLLAIAQQAATLHGLGHAADTIHGKSGAPAEQQKCDTHYACAQLAGAAPATPPALPRVEPSAPPRFFNTASEALQPARLAFHSRAPPA